MKKLLILTLISFSILATPLFAQNQICINNNTLQTTFDGLVCVDGDCFEVNRTSNENCLFGCDSDINNCRFSASISNLWFIVIIVGLIGFFIWVRRKI